MIEHIIQYYNKDNKGRILSEIFKLNGETHNDNGPAFIWYYDNGKIFTKSYWINGKCHNDNGPAVIHYYINGEIKYEAYYRKGDLI